MTDLERAHVVLGGDWNGNAHTAFVAGCDVVALVGGVVRARCKEAKHSEEEIMARWGDGEGNAPAGESTGAFRSQGEDTEESSKVADDGQVNGRLGTNENGPGGESRAVSRPAEREAPTGTENSKSAGGGQADATVSRGTSALLRVPPNNYEAEQSVLGAILLVNDAIEQACRLLRAEDFYRESHVQIFAAMVDLWRNKIGIDATTLQAELAQRHHVEALRTSQGGEGYLAELAAMVPTAQHVEHYSRIVRDMAIKRDIASRATRLASLAYDGVSADALIGEAGRLVPPIDTGRLPVLITRDIEIMSGVEFYQRQVNAGPRNWLVEGLLARKEISLWSGKVEAGKTTAMRTLVVCVARGEMFLDRHTYPSRVLYVMLDADGEDVTFEEFGRLGWQPENDPIDFLIDPVMCLRPNSFEQFHAKLLELKPKLVIIDPLGRFQKVEDSGDGGFLGYSMTYAMAEFSELAKRADCHIALLHHIPRGRSDNDDAATAGFGSIAIAGGCNARFVFINKPGHIYTIKSSQGKGGGFVPFDGEQVLERNEETHWVTLRGAYSWSDQAKAVKETVFNLVNNSDEPMGAADIGREIGVQRSIAGSAAKMLYQDGLIDMQVTKANKHLFSKKAAQSQLDL